ncbi:MAG: PHP domain-containing protein [Clostridia bacterium]|nr:PHP domain-containing protein [Clostridia bacterium]
MKNFRYQIHTHTDPCSHCSHMKPEALLQALHDGGYQGCVLTNHFYWGNTGIDTDLPWEEFVKAYEDDYIECKKIAEKYDLDIIFAVEEEVEEGLEILIYGITPEILYAHPELTQKNLENWSKLREECDAVIIQAHPFRNKPSIPVRKVFSHDLIDGIEIFNAGNKPEDNAEAEEYALKNPDLILTAGADSHSPSNACIGGIATDERIRNEKDLAKILKEKDFEIIKG